MERILPRPFIVPGRWSMRVYGGYPLQEQTTLIQLVLRRLNPPRCSSSIAFCFLFVSFLVSHPTIRTPPIHLIQSRCCFPSQPILPCMYRPYQLRWRTIVGALFAHNQFFILDSSQLSISASKTESRCKRNSESSVVNASTIWCLPAANRFPVGSSIEV